MSEQKQATIAVRLVRAGVRACGPYLAGKIYRVETKEAERLIAVKGFERVAEETAIEEIEQ